MGKHVYYGTPTYHSWGAMIQRCMNPKNPRFKDYGKRGITICQRWFKFENFLADMGPCPPGLTLERKDNNGNYEPGNCKWATHKEQQNNTRFNRVFELDGVRMTLAQWSERTGLSQDVIWERVTRMNWGLRKALTTTKQNKYQLPRMVTIDGQTLTLKEWSEVSGVNVETLRRRLKSGGISKHILRKVKHAN